MQNLVMVLILTEFLLLISLIVSIFALIKVKKPSSSKDDGYIMEELEGKIRLYFENLAKDNDSFRKEVASYLEKNMSTSLNQAKDLYGQNEAQSRVINASLVSLGEKLSASLMDLKLASKGELESFSKIMQEEFEKIRGENDKRILDIFEHKSAMVSLVRCDMEKICHDND